MNEAVFTALQLFGQGMAGIFTVLAIIALIVKLLTRLDQKE